MARKMKHKRSKDPKAQRHIAFSKAIRGLEREAHFADGKSLADWRGVKTVTRNRKRDADRKRCRAKVSVDRW